MDKRSTEGKGWGGPVTIFRAERGPDRRFVCIDAEPIREMPMSMGARGLLVWMLDRPNDWEFEAGRIAKRPEVTMGRDGVQALLRELEQLGLVRRSTLRGEGGRFRTLTQVREALHVPWPGESPGGTEDGKAVSGVTRGNGRKRGKGPGRTETGFTGTGETGAGAAGTGETGAGEARSLQKDRRTDDGRTEDCVTDLPPLPPPPHGEGAVVEGGSAMSSTSAPSGDKHTRPGARTAGPSSARTTSGEDRGPPRPRRGRTRDDAVEQANAWHRALPPGEQDRAMELWATVAGRFGIRTASEVSRTRAAVAELHEGGFTAEQVQAIIDYQDRSMSGDAEFSLAWLRRSPSSLLRSAEEAGYWRALSTNGVRA